MKLPSIVCASRTASSSGGHAPPAILAASAKCQKVALWHSTRFGTWHFGTQLRLALGTLALSSVWHLALWHSAPFGTWHFGTQLRLALGTLALDSCSDAWHLALVTPEVERFTKQKVALQLNPPLARTK